MDGVQIHEKDSVSKINKDWNIAYPRGLEKTTLTILESRKLIP